MEKYRMSLRKMWGLLIVAFLCSINAMAEKTAPITAQADVYANEWYMQPWVWLLSGGIFILLFTIILSKENNRDDA